MGMERGRPRAETALWEQDCDGKRCSHGAWALCRCAAYMTLQGSTWRHTSLSASTAHPW